jgi:hypothetical protein
MSSWVDDADAFSDSDDEDFRSVEITEIAPAPKHFGQLAGTFKMEARSKKQIKTHRLSVIEVNGEEVAHKCRALKSTNFYQQAEKKKEQKQKVASRKVPANKKLEQKLASLKKQKSAFRFTWHADQQQKFKKMAEEHESANARGVTKEARNHSPFEVSHRSPTPEAELQVSEAEKVELTLDQRCCQFVFRVLRQSQGKIAASEAWGEAPSLKKKTNSRRPKKNKLRVEFKVELGSVGSKDRRDYKAYFKGLVEDTIRLVTIVKAHKAFEARFSKIRVEREYMVKEQKREKELEASDSKEKCQVIVWFCHQVKASSFSSVFRKAFKDWLKRLIYVQNRWRSRER